MVYVLIGGICTLRSIWKFLIKMGADADATCSNLLCLASINSTLDLEKYFHSSMYVAFSFNTPLKTGRTNGQMGDDSRCFGFD